MNKSIVMLLIGLFVSANVVAREMVTTVEGCKIEPGLNASARLNSWSGSCADGYANGIGKYTQYHAFLNGKVADRIEPGMPVDLYEIGSYKKGVKKDIVIHVGFVYVGSEIDRYVTFTDKGKSISWASNGKCENLDTYPATPCNHAEYSNIVSQKEEEAEKMLREPAQTKTLQAADSTEKGLEWVAPGEFNFESCGNVDGGLVPGPLRSKYFSKFVCKAAYNTSLDVCLQHFQGIKAALDHHKKFSECSKWLQTKLSSCRTFVRKAVRQCDKLAN